MPDKLLLIRLVTRLENLGIDVTGIRASTFWNVATNVNELAFLLTGRARFGRRHHVYGIAAIIAFKNGHLIPPFQNLSLHKV